MQAFKRQKNLFLIGGVDADAAVPDGKQIKICFFLGRDLNPGRRGGVKFNGVGDEIFKNFGNLNGVTP